MKKVFLTIIVTALLLTGCTSYTGVGAYQGAGIGSVIGSAIGGITGGCRGSDVGSLIGMPGLCGWFGIVVCVQPTKLRTVLSWLRRLLR